MKTKVKPSIDYKPPTGQGPDYLDKSNDLPKPKPEIVPVYVGKRPELMTLDLLGQRARELRMIELLEDISLSLEDLPRG